MVFELDDAEDAETTQDGDKVGGGGHLVRFNDINKEEAHESLAVAGEAHAVGVQVEDLHELDPFGKSF